MLLEQILALTKKWDKGSWRKFNLYVLYDNDLHRVFFGNDEEDIPLYWEKPHKTKSGVYIW